MRTASEESEDLIRLRSRSRSRLADLLAHVFDPLIVVVVALLLVGTVASPDPVRGFTWAAGALVFCALVPEIALRVFMRAGGITDRHLVRREHRRVPLLVACASVLVSALLMWWFSAPRAVLSGVLVVLAGVGVMTVVTRWWKASIHTAVVASMGVLLWVFVSPVTAVVMVPVTLAVGWARVRAGRHSLAQVVGGGLIGISTAALVLAAL